MVEKRFFLARMMHPCIVFLGYLFLYIPVVVLVTFSFNDSPISLSWKGFTLHWYQKMLQMPELLNAVKVSLVVATASAFLSVVLAMFLVIASHWWRPKFLFESFYANIVLPDIVISIGILTMFSYFDIPLGYPSLIAGHTVIGLGFAVPIFLARFLEFDPHLTEASLDLGADFFQTCYRVIIPLLSPAIIASALLAFTLSLDDFIISFFCSSPQIQTLSVYIYFQIKTLVEPTINAASTCFLFVSSLTILVMTYFKVLDRAFSHE